MSTLQQITLESGLSGKNIAIIGGGPAGGLAALGFAQKNAKVTVFEKRSRAAASGGNDRSINVTISEKGKRALEEFGMWQSIEPYTMAVEGRMCHSGMEQQPFLYSGDGSRVLYSVRRSKMSEVLLQAAECLTQVTIKYGHSIASIDEPTGTVLMQEGDFQNARYEGFDLIIGADGAHSQTRKLLQEGHAVSQSETYLPWGYREVRLPSRFGAQSENEMASNYLHLWPNKDVMMFALPNTDGSFGANFVFPLDEEENIFEEEKLMTFLKDRFPDLEEIAPTLAKELASKKTSHFYSQRSSMWHSHDRIVIVGDAAHSTVPFYGEGMNSAFDSVSCLINRLDRQWKHRALVDVFKDYQAERKPNTDKIADLSLENFEQLRSSFGQLGPQAERMAQVIFHAVAPRIFTPIHILISHRALGYKDAEKQYNRQRKMAMLLGLGLLKQACACWIASLSYYQRIKYPTLTIR